MGCPESYRALKDADDLDDVMAPNAGAVVIGLWSRSCPACGAMVPAFEAVAARFVGMDVQFCAVETDAQPALASAVHTQSVPTLLFCLDGEVVFAIVGRFDVRRLTQQVQWLLAKREREGFFARWFRFRRAASP